MGVGRKIVEAYGDTDVPRWKLVDPHVLFDAADVPACPHAAGEVAQYIAEARKFVHDLTHVRSSSQMVMDRSIPTYVRRSCSLPSVKEIYEIIFKAWIGNSRNRMKIPRIHKDHHLEFQNELEGPPLEKLDTIFVAFMKYFQSTTGEYFLDKSDQFWNKKESGTELDVDDKIFWLYEKLSFAHIQDTENAAILDILERNPNRPDIASSEIVYSGQRTQMYILHNFSRMASKLCEDTSAAVKVLRHPKTRGLALSLAGQHSHGSMTLLEEITETTPYVKGFPEAGEVMAYLYKEDAFELAGPDDDQFLRLKDSAIEDSAPKVRHAIRGAAMKATTGCIASMILDDERSSLMVSDGSSRKGTANLIEMTYDHFVDLVEHHGAV